MGIPDMGEFAASVWSSYGLVLIAFVWLAIQSWREQKRFSKKADQLKVQIRGENERI